jgi:hypothetical protein
MSTLYECQECDPKKMVKSAQDHAIETGHTNFIAKSLNVAGLQETPTQVLPMQLLPDFHCPECGLAMTQNPRIADYVTCPDPEHGDYTKEMVKELWERQNGKPKGEPSSEKRPLFGLPHHLGKRQKIGIFFFVVPPFLLVIYIYTTLFMGWRWF